jgi:hypothetical protein
MTIHLIGAPTTCSGVRRFKAGLDLDLVATKTLVGSDRWAASVPLV